MMMLMMEDDKAIMDNGKEIDDMLSGEKSCLVE